MNSYLKNVLAKALGQGSWELCDSSSELVSGEVFIDLAKDVRESERHMIQAYERGAVAVLTSHASHQFHATIPVFHVPRLRDQISLLASEYYDHPSHKVQLVGVTGTNGKTTITMAMLQAAEHLGIRCGYIGTLGYGTRSQDLGAQGLTTPSALKVQKILHQMVQEGVTLVVMEVSSHALVQQRVSACVFDLAMFTNLSRDHLDYHQNMFDYAQAKKKLFTQHVVHHVLLNLDDPVGKQWETELNVSKLGITFEDTQASCPRAVFNLDYSDMRGNALDVVSPWGQGHLTSVLTGKFNAYNLAMAWMGMVSVGYDLHAVAGALANVRRIPGRLEWYRSDLLKPMVVIDYAHTPTALEEVLKTLRGLTKHHLWVVFGCGGNRDQGKRALMGQIAERLADRVMLTNDNPRHENPEAIIGDILKGMICPWAVEIELDRVEAIHRVIQEAKAGDIVLVAGKGHENYQIIRHQMLEFSDRVHVCNALGVEAVS